MGVKYTREYEDIIVELTEAIYEIPNFYDFFDMTSEDWNDIPEDERKACASTLADDIFYALGNEPVLSVGSGTIKHNKVKNSIMVSFEGTDIEVAL
jgi:hypothetical protein